MLAQGRSAYRGGHRGRRALALAALLLAGLGGAVVVYWRWPTLGQIERGWIERAGYDPLEAFPAHEANATAQRLDELAARFGLAILQPGSSFRVAPSDSEVRRLDGIREALSGYVREARRADAEPAPPPPSLARFLEKTEPVLRQVADVLVDGEAPRWPMNVDWHEPDGFNTLAHMKLQRLLWSAAQRDAAGGRPQDSRRWLDAAWRLTESLAENPGGGYQLVAGVELEDQLALLRSLPGPLPGWSERLAPRPLRQRMMNGVALDLWRTSRFLHDHPPEGLLPEYSPSPNLLIRLQVRRGVGRVAESIQRAAKRLENDSVRPSDAQRIIAEQLAEIPRWNMVAQWVEPNPIGLWNRAAHAELALDLTRRTLEAREAMRSGDGAALAALAAGGDQPAVVAGVSWVYAVTPEAVAILAAGDLPGSTPTYRIPLEVRIERRREPLRR